MLGLNIDRFKKDMESEQAKARVRSDEQQARALGLATTPSIFLNNSKLPHAYVNPPGLRVAIDSAMKKASK
jgi:predicted DsbA family dithiol-disulfide isomerase